MELKILKKKPLTTDERRVKFYKKIKANKCSTENELNEQIYAFVKKSKKLDLIYLTQEQRVNPLFMAVLYNINPDIVQYYKPDNKLQKNLMFMKNYIRTMVSHYMEKHSSMKDVLLEVLEDCDEALKNIDFVEAIIDLFPGSNSLVIINEVLTKNRAPGYFDIDRYNALLNIMENLPKEYFEKELKYNYGEVLKIIDPKHKFYEELARFAVRTHGFKALENIDKDHLKDNVKLLYHATDKEGVNSLYKYIMFDLEVKSYDLDTVKQTKKDLRKTFLKDSKIRDYLSNDFFVTNQMVDILYKE